MDDKEVGKKLDNIIDKGYIKVLAEQFDNVYGGESFKKMAIRVATRNHYNTGTFGKPSDIVKQVIREIEL